MTPVAATGWNLDVVVEKGAPGPPFTNFATGFDTPQGNVFYETDHTPYPWGLPPSGFLLGMLADDTLFQLQPYTAKNALVLNAFTGITNGTLTLATPKTYSRIAILAHSFNATGETGPLTIHFQDGTDVATTYYAPDSINGATSVAWFGSGEINVASGNETQSLDNPRFYQTTVDIQALLGGGNRPISSLVFGQVTGQSTAIYAISGLLAPTNSVSLATATPVAATGWNRDLVIENTAGGPPYNQWAAELNPGEGNVFYQRGLRGTQYGLPVSGSFASAVDGAVFQLQSYTNKNALVLSSETGISNGTLSLIKPAIYNSISVIANSAAGGGMPNVTINFLDGTTWTTNFNAQDWFYNTVNVALQGFDRISLTTGATQGGPTDPRFYQTTFYLADFFGVTNKSIKSLTFNQAQGVGATAVYALSGVEGNQTNGIYSLATVTNAPATNIQFQQATVGGGVVSAGGSAPEVLIYYGTADGGMNGEAWSNRVLLGTEAGAFTEELKGLSVNTLYYYRVAAINPAGVSWATNSESFVTRVVALPLLTNLSVSNIISGAAVLYGDILTTGGNAQAVTLFYGPNNGGTNPAAWSNAVTITEPQTGLFAYAASGLTGSQNYYYTALASNISGVSWANQIEEFRTAQSGPRPGDFVSILTGRSDVGRTGLNSHEVILTPTNVSSANFGRLFSYPVDGCMIAQPLVLANVSIPGGGVHNLVFAATEHDSVFAFDADNNTGANASPIWHTSFINPAGGVTPLSTATDLQASTSPGFYGPEVGISSTPVIDPVSGTIYVVAKTKEITANSTNYFHRLHALDVATGAEKFGGPIVIEGSVQGFGDGFEFPGVVSFLPWKHMTRPALLLNGGVLTVSFSSHQDFPPYHGWVFTYNPYTLQQLGVFCTTPNGSAGSIWQASSGPAADDQGNVYFETGNGTFNASDQNFGDSVVKLSTTNGLTLSDYFAPNNQLFLNLEDLDIGSAGLILLPDAVGSAAHRHLLVAGSKTGVFWLLDRDNLGQFNIAGDNQIVQEIAGAVAGMWVTPAYFNGRIYYCAGGDYIKAFAVSNAVIQTTPVSQSLGTISYPGSSLSISANGVDAAIVWALDSSAHLGGPAVLHAYNAEDLTQELYSSDQNASRDFPGIAIKFTMPTIANGKVYIGTADRLSVFGNLTTLLAPVILPGSGIYTNDVEVSISSPSAGAKIFYTTDGSIPTTNSTLYSAPFRLVTNSIVQAISAKSGTPNSLVASATYSFFNSALLGGGSGLTGRYYANTGPKNPFEGNPLGRVDPTIDFVWGTGSPDPSIPPANYTVRWVGMVQPLFTETYTFSVTADDGVRLWVNGQLMINHWVPSSPTTWSGSIPLQALQLYEIELEHFQGQDSGVTQLAWSSPSTPSGIIPQSQLYPFTGAVPFQLLPTSQLTNGVVRLQLSAPPGKSYLVQWSTNLLDWSPLSTNVPVHPLQTLLEVGVTDFPRQYFRAVQLP